MSVTAKDRETAERLTAFDQNYKAAGQVLVGMDEAGRGPLAGPVVAAAVVMPEMPIVYGVNDSKKLSEKKREALYEEIMQTAISVGVGVVDEKMIDEINILNAARMAFMKAFEQISVPSDRVLSDQISGLSIPGYISIVRGDAKSYTIAAASIVAKVTRDRMMRDYAEQYPEYGFETHKGYGSAAHIMAIKTYGVCDIHRKTFLTRILTD